VFGLLTALHVLVAIVLVLAVLLQSARGADLAGAFGGMGSQTAFGPRGTATFLSKATVVLAVTFMLTSITLAILGNQIRGTGGPSVLGGETDAPAGSAAPVEPGTPPAPPAGTPGPATEAPTTNPPAGAGQPAQPAEPAPSAPTPPPGQ
jgi:preprotein translocase subunit SecG